MRKPNLFEKFIFALKFDSKRWLFLFVFISMSWFWGVTVTNYAVNIGCADLKCYLLILAGAGWIACVGLRLFFLIGPPMPNCQPIEVMGADWSGIELMPPDHNSHRHPYIVRG